MNLTYRSHATIESLAENECTVHRAGDPAGRRWWNLWFYVRRETDGVLEDFVVPIIPGGGYTESGPGGRSWGFTQAAPGAWQVSPSINVLNDDDARRVEAGASAAGRSLWHQTPIVINVPIGEPWMVPGAAP